MAGKNTTAVSAEEFEALKAQLMADLEAERAKNQALQAELEKRGKAGRKAPEFPADRLVDADSVLGKVQRMDRGHVFDALPKLARAVGIADTCEIVVSLAEKVAEATGKDVAEVITTYTTPTKRAPKGEKAPAKVEDTTGEDQTQGE